MSDWASFMKKKGVPPQLETPEGEAWSAPVVILQDRFDSNQLLDWCRTATADVVYLVLARDIGEDFPVVLEFAMRTSEDFEYEPALALMIIKNKGTIPTRRRFLVECGPALSATTPEELFPQLARAAKDRDLEIKMVSEESYDVMRCAEGFIDEDYSVCLRVAGPGFVHLRDPSAVLLTLVALQRLSRTNELTQLLGIIERKHSSNGWLREVAKLLTGERQVAELLAVARSDVERYQAHFYAGARLKTMGRAMGAREEFQQCLATPASCVEQALLEVEMAGLAG